MNFPLKTWFKEGILLDMAFLHPCIWLEWIARQKCLFKARSHNQFRCLGECRDVSDMVPVMVAIQFY